MEDKILELESRIELLEAELKAIKGCDQPNTNIKPEKKKSSYPFGFDDAEDFVAFLQFAIFLPIAFVAAMIIAYTRYHYSG